MEYTPFLRALDVFEGLPDAELARLATRLQLCHFRQGQTVVRRGDPADAMYLVFEGHLQAIIADAQGQQRVLASYDAGGFFGEMALLAKQPRPADVQAVTDCTLLQLRCEDFEEWVASNPLVARELLRQVAERQLAPGGLQTPQVAPDRERGAQLGKVFTVYSAKGGCGKTMVAANLAVALAQMFPAQVVLLDLALTFGHAALLLNLQPRASLASVGLDALSEFDRPMLDRYLVRHASSLHVLSGVTRPEEGEQLSQAHVDQILALLKSFFAYVVVDTTADFEDATLATLEKADRILFVLTPELTTLHDMRECQRIFADVLHIPDERGWYLLNHATPATVLSREDFERGLGRAVHNELPYGGETPAQAQARGEPFVVCQPATPIARGIDRMAHTLTGTPTRPGQADTPARELKRGGLLSRILGSRGPHRDS